MRKYAIALDYRIGIQDFKQILAVGDMKAPILFSYELEIKDAINIVNMRLVMEKHPLASKMFLAATIMGSIICKNNDFGYM